MHVNENKVNNDGFLLNNKDGEDNAFELSEQSFYPPEDDRVYTSGIDDICGGDSFAEYVEYFWEMYEGDICDDIIFAPAKLSI